MPHTEREWWKVELSVARLIEKSDKEIALVDLAALLGGFLRTWDARNDDRLSLKDGSEPVLVLRLGERATPENAKGRVVALIARRTETITNLVARATYARESAAVRVFLFCPSLVYKEDVPSLERVCDAFFYADPTAGGERTRTLGRKGVVLRTVMLPSGIDPSIKYCAHC